MRAFILKGMKDKGYGNFEITKQEMKDFSILLETNKNLFGNSNFLFEKILQNLGLPIKQLENTQNFTQLTDSFI